MRRQREEELLFREVSIIYIILLKSYFRLILRKCQQVFWHADTFYRSF